MSMSMIYPYTVHAMFERDSSSEGNPQRIDYNTRKIHVVACG